MEHETQESRGHETVPQLVYSWTLLCYLRELLKLWPIPCLVRQNGKIMSYVAATFCLLYLTNRSDQLLYLAFSVFEYVLQAHLALFLNGCFFLLL